MRIVYIILAHKFPKQLARLVQRLNTVTASFFIHVDKKVDAETYKRITDLLSGNENVYFLERHARYYGDFNHVKATLQGIQKVSDLDIQYDYIVLLTGQDYPIKSNSQIQRALEESGGRSFMEYFPLPDKRWRNDNGGLDRVSYFYLHWHGWEFPFLKKNRFLKFIPDRLWSVLAEILPIQRSLPSSYAIYGGSAYWCLTKECIEYINEFAQRNIAFVKFFKHVKIPEEIFFQMVLMNSPFKNHIINDNLRYIVWSTSRHPANLCKQDFEHIMSTDKLFARKFDTTVDSDVLDMIDQAIS